MASWIFFVNSVDAYVSKDLVHRSNHLLAFLCSNMASFLHAPGRQVESNASISTSGPSTNVHSRNVNSKLIATGATQRPVLAPLTNVIAHHLSSKNRKSNPVFPDGITLLPPASQNNYTKEQLQLMCKRYKKKDVIKALKDSGYGPKERAI